MTVIVPGVRLGYQITSAAELDQAVPRSGPAGLVLGFDLNERPVTLRMHGGEATRLVLVGGLRCAQVLALRAAGMGLHVLVRSPRAAAWNAVAQAVNPPREPVSSAPGGRPPQVVIADPGPVAPVIALRAAGVGLHALVRSPRAAAWNAVAQAVNPPRGPVSSASGGRPPQVVIVDTGPIAEEPTPHAEPAQATLVVREELTTWDASTLTWADVVILQRLTEAEATLAAKTLRIADATTGLTRLRDDMAALVHQGSVHWVQLRPTSVELDLIGSPTRR